MITPALKQFIREHAQDDLQRLAFQGVKYPEVDIPFVLQQLKGRRMATYKIPSWSEKEDVLYPRQISMEQCSSETTARFKASLVGNSPTLVDLTGGFGVDFYFMAQQASHAIYVEMLPELADTARHNFDVLKLTQAEIVCADSVEFLRSMDFKADTIFIDPARRDQAGQKTVLLQDCTPDLTLIDELLEEKGTQILIKLSPMLDITASVKALRHISEVYVIAVQNEVKELLLRKRKTDGAVRIHAVHFRKHHPTEDFIFTTEEETGAVASTTSVIGKYLFEPNAAVLKAGAYKILSSRFALKKLDANTHLYTADVYPADFPGRVFEVKDTFMFGKKEIKNLLSKTNRANISVRNFPISADELRKKLKLKDGGEDYLFAATLSGNKKILLLTRKI